MWRWIVGAVVVLLAAVANYTIVTEFYGSGPPYYGRTKNLDKWSNPLPILGFINGGAAALCLLVVKVSKQRGRGVQVR